MAARRSMYRCPKCNCFYSVNVDKIFDGRLLFSCSKCNICAIIPKDADGPDSAYLEFLDLYDNGRIADSNNLKAIMQQERILRPPSEIKTILEKANEGTTNKLLKEVLSSQKDYVVEYRLIQDSDTKLGSEVNELPLDDKIISVLYRKGIKHVYEFQEQSINRILLGMDTVIVAPTASGKTEAFCIPILQKISDHLGSHSSHMFTNQKTFTRSQVSAIFLYPTKALSRDQLPKIREFAESLGIRVGIFDGDTSVDERNMVLSATPEIIITNFDVLHYHLWHRTEFSYLLRTSKFLVVDEAHIYTGVLGANVHYIVKRLERLCENKLQIVAASATLPNAAEFCRTLFGREIQVINGRGRWGRINLAIIFPSLRSYRSLMLDLLRQTTKRKHKTIVFASSHLSAELMAFYGSRQGINIRVHRAGLISAHRKEIEQEFKAGQLMAISATPTLELGIDIGSVDAIISNIVPINRLFQRVGRAARRGQQGYAFLALGNDPISQYYKMHPADYMDDHELAYTDPSNPFVLEYQVLAMTCDKPLLIAESKQMWGVLQKLVSKGIVKVVRDRFMPNLKEALKVLDEYSIRGIGSRVDIKFNSKIVGDRALPQALEELHQHAVYFLGGRRYRVQEIHFGTT